MNFSICDDSEWVLETWCLAKVLFDRFFFYWWWYSSFYFDFIIKIWLGLSNVEKERRLYSNLMPFSYWPEAYNPQSACLSPKLVVALTVIFLVVKLAVGGFSMGAATSLYSATCFAQGKYGNGNSYPSNLSAVVGLSGWLPCSKFDV